MNEVGRQHVKVNSSPLSRFPFKELTYGLNCWIFKTASQQVLTNKMKFILKNLAQINALCLIDP